VALNVVNRSPRGIESRRRKRFTAETAEIAERKIERIEEKGEAAGQNGAVLGSRGGDAAELKKVHAS
jgi:hypothetical protein